MRVLTSILKSTDIKTCDVVSQGMRTSSSAVMSVRHRDKPPVCRARQLRPDIVEQTADGVDRPRGQPARLLLHDQRSVPDLLHRSSAQQQGLHEAQRHRPDIEGIPATSNSTVRWFSDKMS